MKTIHFPRPHVLACSLMLAFVGVHAHAQSFEEAVQSARRADAQYTSALASAQGRHAQARQAGSAYWPAASISYKPSDSSSGRSTRSIGVSQPLLSYDKLLSMRQAEPLDALANAEATKADNDLVLRVFTAMADIVRYREQIRAIGVQIDGLQEQLRRARRMHELGQGTVTEISDFETRVAVAQANRIGLQNQLQAAQRQFTLVTGLTANVSVLRVDPAQPWPQPPAIDQFVADARQNTVAVLAARQNVDLARIAAKRVVAQYLPEVTLQVSRSQTAGISSDVNRVGVTLSAPLGASPYFEQQRAAVDVQRTQEDLRYAEESSAAEAAKLHASYAVLNEEVKVRSAALESARLAVNANVRSYQGGVKSNMDVITSYQNLADAEVSLVNTMLSLREAELRIVLLAGNVSVAR